jgi:hypothetical protein
MISQGGRQKSRMMFVCNCFLWEPNNDHPQELAHILFSRVDIHIKVSDILHTLSWIARLLTMYSWRKCNQENLEFIKHLWLNIMACGSSQCNLWHFETSSLCSLDFRISKRSTIVSDYWSMRIPCSSLKISLFHPVVAQEWKDIRCRG